MTNNYLSGVYTHIFGRWIKTTQTLEYLYLQPALYTDRKQALSHEEMMPRRRENHFGEWKNGHYAKKKKKISKMSRQVLKLYAFCSSGISSLNWLPWSRRASVMRYANRIFIFFILATIRSGNRGSSYTHRTYFKLHWWSVCTGKIPNKYLFGYLHVRPSR